MQSTQNEFNKVCEMFNKTYTCIKNVLDTISQVQLKGSQYNYGGVSTDLRKLQNDFYRIIELESQSALPLEAKISVARNILAKMTLVRDAILDLKETPDFEKFKESYDFFMQGVEDIDRICENLVRQRKASQSSHCSATTTSSTPSSSSSSPGCSTTTTSSTPSSSSSSPSCSTTTITPSSSSSSSGTAKRPEQSTKVEGLIAAFKDVWLKILLFALTCPTKFPKEIAEARASIEKLIMDFEGDGLKMLQYEKLYDTEFGENTIASEIAGLGGPDKIRYLMKTIDLLNSWFAEMMGQFDAQMRKTGGFYYNKDLIPKMLTALHRLQTAEKTLVASLTLVMGKVFDETIKEQIEQVKSSRLLIGDTVKKCQQPQLIDDLNSQISTLADKFKKLEEVYEVLAKAYSTCNQANGQGGAYCCSLDQSLYNNYLELYGDCFANFVLSLARINFGKMQEIDQKNKNIIREAYNEELPESPTLEQVAERIKKLTQYAEAIKKLKEDLRNNQTFFEGKRGELSRLFKYGNFSKLSNEVERQKILSEDLNTAEAAIKDLIRAAEEKKEAILQDKFDAIKKEKSEIDKTIANLARDFRSLRPSKKMEKEKLIEYYLKHTRESEELKKLNEGIVECSRTLNDLEGRAGDLLKGSNFKGALSTLFSNTHESLQGLEKEIDPIIAIINTIDEEKSKKNKELTDLFAEIKKGITAMDHNKINQEGVTFEAKLKTLQTWLDKLKVYSDRVSRIESINTNRDIIKSLKELKKTISEKETALKELALNVLDGEFSKIFLTEAYKKIGDLIEELKNYPYFCFDIRNSQGFFKEFRREPITEKLAESIARLRPLMREYQMARDMVEKYKLKKPVDSKMEDCCSWVGYFDEQAYAIFRENSLRNIRYARKNINCLLDKYNKEKREGKNKIALYFHLKELRFKLLLSLADLELFSQNLRALPSGFFLAGHQQALNKSARDVGVYLQNILAIIQKEFTELEGTKIEDLLKNPDLNEDQYQVAVPALIEYLRIIKFSINRMADDSYSGIFDASQPSSEEAKQIMVAELRKYQTLLNQMVSQHEAKQKEIEQGNKQKIQQQLDEINEIGKSIAAMDPKKTGVTFEVKLKTLQTWLDALESYSDRVSGIESTDKRINDRLKELKELKKTISAKETALNELAYTVFLEKRETILPAEKMRALNSCIDNNNFEALVRELQPVKTSLSTLFEELQNHKSILTVKQYARLEALIRKDLEETDKEMQTFKARQEIEAPILTKIKRLGNEKQLFDTITEQLSESSKEKNKIIRLILLRFLENASRDILYSFKGRLEDLKNNNTGCYIHNEAWKNLVKEIEANIEKFDLLKKEIQEQLAGLELPTEITLQTINGCVNGPEPFDYDKAVAKLKSCLSMLQNFKNYQRNERLVVSRDGYREDRFSEDFIETTRKPEIEQVESKIREAQELQKTIVLWHETTKTELSRITKEVNNINKKIMALSQDFEKLKSDATANILKNKKDKFKKLQGEIERCLTTLTNLEGRLKELPLKFPGVEAQIALLSELQGKASELDDNVKQAAAVINEKQELLNERLAELQGYIKDFIISIDPNKLTEIPELTLEHLEKSLVLLAAYREMANDITAVAQYYKYQNKEFNQSLEDLQKEIKELAYQVFLKKRMTIFPNEKLETLNSYINSYVKNGDFADLAAFVRESQPFRAPLSELLKELKKYKDILTRERYSHLYTHMQENIEIFDKESRNLEVRQKEQTIILNDLRSWMQSFNKITDPKSLLGEEKNAIIRFIGLSHIGYELDESLYRSKCLLEDLNNNNTKFYIHNEAWKNLVKEIEANIAKFNSLKSEIQEQLKLCPEIMPQVMEEFLVDAEYEKVVTKLGSGLKRLQGFEKALRNNLKLSRADGSLKNNFSKGHIETITAEIGQVEIKIQQTQDLRAKIVLWHKTKEENARKEAKESRHLMGQLEKLNKEYSQVTKEYTSKKESFNKTSDFTDIIERLTGILDKAKENNKAAEQLSPESDARKRLTGLIGELNSYIAQVKKESKECKDNNTNKYRNLEEKITGLEVQLKGILEAIPGKEAMDAQLESRATIAAQLEYLEETKSKLLELRKSLDEIPNQIDLARRETKEIPFVVVKNLNERLTDLREKTKEVKKYYCAVEQGISETIEDLKPQQARLEQEQKERQLKEQQERERLEQEQREKQKENYDKILIEIKKIEGQIKGVRNIFWDDKGNWQFYAEGKFKNLAWSENNLVKLKGRCCPPHLNVDQSAACVAAINELQEEIINIRRKFEEDKPKAVRDIKNLLAGCGVILDQKVEEFKKLTLKTSDEEGSDLKQQSDNLRERKWQLEVLKRTEESQQEFLERLEKEIEALKAPDSDIKDQEREIEQRIMEFLQKIWVEIKKVSSAIEKKESQERDRQQKLEEDKRRLEEEKRKQEQEEARRKQEEAKKEQEEENRKLEEEKTRQEEENRKQAEEAKIKQELEEDKTRQEEENKKLEEAKIKQEETNKKQEEVKRKQAEKAEKAEKEKEAKKEKTSIVKELGEVNAQFNKETKKRISTPITLKDLPKVAEKILALEKLLGLLETIKGKIAGAKENPNLKKALNEAQKTLNDLTKKITEAKQKFSLAFTGKITEEKTRLEGIEKQVQGITEDNLPSTYKGCNELIKKLEEDLKSVIELEFNQGNSSNSEGGNPFELLENYNTLAADLKTLITGKINLLENKLKVLCQTTLASVEEIKASFAKFINEKETEVNGIIAKGNAKASDIEEQKSALQECLALIDEEKSTAEESLLRLSNDSDNTGDNVLNTEAYQKLQEKITNKIKELDNLLSTVQQKEELQQRLEKFEARIKEIETDFKEIVAVEADSTKEIDEKIAKLSKLSESVESIKSEINGLPEEAKESLLERVDELERGIGIKKGEFLKMRSTAEKREYREEEGKKEQEKEQQEKLTKDENIKEITAKLTEIETALKGEEPTQEKLEEYSKEIERIENEIGAVYGFFWD